MKVRRGWDRLLLPLVVALLTHGSGLEAQQLDHGRDGVELEGFGGIYLPGKIDFQVGENAFQLDESRLIVGGRLAYTFGFNLFLEASLAYTPLRMTMADSSITNLDTFIGTGVIGYNLQVMPTAQLFILAGGGVTQSVPKSMATERQIEGVFGGGLRIFITRGLALRTEVRDHVIPKTLTGTRERLNPGLTIEDKLTHNLEVTAGITLFFGAARDSDDDRVLNLYDACPGTPAAVRSDAYGCPLDGDGDGVPDYQDRCPSTPPGTAVNDEGCPLDFDGDGVTDDMDRCPGTALGVRVDVNGCPIDSDADGVFDGPDLCPNTPAGATVNQVGCPLDSDGDGVYDGIDRCPNTPQEREVDEVGCSLVQAGLERGRLILSSIFFQTGSSDLMPQSRRVLDEVGQALLDRPEIRVEVQGHTDSTGGADTNLRLSEQRARSVFTYLVSTFPGLDRTRFVVRGLGESRPIATNDTPDGRSMNRRVEFVVIGGE
ncbi:MAG TPA: OmpA family protein [Gemmatimonadota bacterium]|nr:OmpA family protein [Gemmatimonadota bacterium]